MKQIILAAAALALMALPAASWSQEAPTTKKDRFAAADTDSDGSLSKEEAAAAKINEARFTKMDTDANGKLSKEEFKAAMAAAKKGKKKAAASGATPE